MNRFLGREGSRDNRASHRRALPEDNRLLPDGFDKRTADADIAVVGEALNDPAFTAAVIASAIRSAGNATGPFTSKRTVVPTDRLPLGQ